MTDIQCFDIVDGVMRPLK